MANSSVDETIKNDDVIIVKATMIQHQQSIIIMQNSAVQPFFPLLNNRLL